MSHDFDDESNAPSHLELDVQPMRPAPRPSAPVAPLVAPPPRMATPPKAAPSHSPLRLVIAAAVVLAALSVALFLVFRPARVPDISVAGPEGGTLHLKDLHQGHDRLVVVFLVAGDSLSPFAAKALASEYASKSEFLGFVGFYVGKQAEADRARADLALPFPVYGLRDAPDPFSVQDFVKKVGIDTWTSAVAVYGGTTVLLDRNERVLFRLERDEVRTLPQKMATILQ